MQKLYGYQAIDNQCTLEFWPYRPPGVSADAARTIVEATLNDCGLAADTRNNMYMLSFETLTVIHAVRFFTLLQERLSAATSQATAHVENILAALK